MSTRLNEYLENTREVLHTTLNPYGPGAIRIHLVPPDTSAAGVPWAVILNGQDVLALNTSWAVLLAEFIRQVNRREGAPLGQTELEQAVAAAVKSAQKVFTKTEADVMRQDLAAIVNTLVDAAKGKAPAEEIGCMSLAEYAPYMRAPHRMDLMISSMEQDGQWHCNQKCLHCYAAGQSLGKRPELSTQQWKTIIDRCRDACIPQLTFTGGEPTLRADLPELVEYAAWFVTRLNTNGALLTKQLCKSLADASLDAVQVTLYSADGPVHDRLVGARHFDDTVAGIQNALEAGLNVSVNTPLCALNTDYVSTLALCKKLGVRYFSASGLIQTGASLTEASIQTRLDGDGLYRVLGQAAEYCETSGLELTFTSPGYLTEQQLGALKLQVPSCGACLSNMAVAPDGTVVPCQSWLDEDAGLGNLLNKKWNKIWKSDRCRLLRRNTAAQTQVCPLMQRAGKEGAQ